MQHVTIWAAARFFRTCRRAPGATPAPPRPVLLLPRHVRSGSHPCRLSFPFFSPISYVVFPVWSLLVAAYVFPFRGATWSWACLRGRPPSLIARSSGKTREQPRSKHKQPGARTTAAAAPRARAHSIAPRACSCLSHRIHGRATCACVRWLLRHEPTDAASVPRRTRTDMLVRWTAGHEYGKRGVRTPGSVARAPPPARAVGRWWFSAVVGPVGSGGRSRHS